MRGPFTATQRFAKFEKSVFPNPRVFLFKINHEINFPMCLIKFDFSNFHFTKVKRQKKKSRMSQISLGCRPNDRFFWILQNGGVRKLVK